MQFMEPILKVKNLSFGFEKNLLFSGLNFDIAPSNWIGIIGPNGCGKTTLLHLLLGELRPLSGEVHIQASRIGYVPQLNPFNEDLPLSALDVVLMGNINKITWLGNYPKKVHEKAEKHLQLFDLSSQMHTPFSQLSGGQKKRVLLARALMDDPELLILDEPTSGVDSKSKEKIYQVLEKLPTTIIQVTHEIDTIVKKVDLVLSLGEKIQLLKPKEICEHFAKGLYHNPLIESNC